MNTTERALRDWAKYRPKEMHIDGRWAWTNMSVPSVDLDIDFICDNVDHIDFDDHQQALHVIGSYATRLLVEEGWKISIEPQPQHERAAMVFTVGKQHKSRSVLAMQYPDGIIRIRAAILRKEAQGL